MNYFKKVFPLVVLVSFWMVLLLSIIQIRRNLVPLNRLKEGTEQLAMGQLDAKVTISTDDEFEELADSFNKMAGRLGKQFRTLTTLGEIDRAILSSFKPERITHNVLGRVFNFLSCDGVSIGLMDAENKDVVLIHTGYNKSFKENAVTKVSLSSDELKMFNDHPHSFQIEPEQTIPKYAGSLAQNGMKSFLVLPILLKENLSGFIVLGYIVKPEQHSSGANKTPDHMKEDWNQARHLRDQMAVAFSNADLIRELGELNWGALTALARAVDAKSPWTAGHSERVTKIAIYIGRKMGLDSHELDNLRRASLLHDVGKIGIPSTILDKPGKLTGEEYTIIKSHPKKGERILQPIKAYSNIIPIVSQHHEQYGGGGYPDGLVGEEICLGARILAVADTYDAMVSDRPYRKGMEKKHIINIIKKEAGKQFDPQIVDVFLKRERAEKSNAVHPGAIKSSGDATVVEQQT